MTITEKLSVAKDIASILSGLSGLAAVAALIGATAAWRSLKSWRQQLTGRTQYELARRLLRCVYKVRDEIRSVRNPAIFPGEFVEASTEAGIEHDSSKPGFSHEQTRAVYHRRWRRLVDAISDFDVELLEAEVLWGQEITEQMLPLRQCINKLGININRLLDSGDPNIHRRRALSRKHQEEMSAVIYEVSTNPAEDEFTAEVNAAIDPIEKFIRPYLKL